MEARVLLSAAVHHAVKHVIQHRPIASAHHPLLINPLATSNGRRSHRGASPADTFGYSSPAGGITPAQMAGSYLGTNFNYFGVTGDGTGQTIAIIDAYDNPGLVSSTATNFATSDLAIFDSYYHLPNPPSFIKYGVSNSRVNTTPPIATDPNGPYSQSQIVSWEAEEALDVEWAHAMAPKANIALIEVANYNIAKLMQGVVAADFLPGVSVVSMSFTVDEGGLLNSQEAVYNTDFTTNSGITFLAAAGDFGAYGTSGSVQPQFPAVMPSVVAVGGTTLSVSGTSYGSETTWGNDVNSDTLGGGGGGTSLFNSQPAYQTTLLGSASNRQYPDISLEGNYHTGVAIYDTWDFGAGTGWVPGTIGGTSLATPLMAGIVAVADQGRAMQNPALPLLNSNGLSGGVDIHTLLYGFAGTTSSYNPHADFHDITTGSAIGTAGPDPNYSPETGYDLATGIGSPVANNLVFDLSGISATPAANQPALTSLYFKPDAVSTLMDVWVNAAVPGSGTPTYKFLTADIGSYTDSGGSEAFTLILPAGTATGSASGLTVNTPAGTAFTVGSSYVNFATTAINFNNVSTLNLVAAAGANTLGVIGNPTGSDTFTTTANYVDLNSLAINETNISSVAINPGAGMDALSVNSGTVTVAAQSAGLGILTRNFSSMSIASGAAALFATAPLHTDRMLIGTNSISVLGRLDLGGNDMVIHNGNLTAITALLATGYANGQWNGFGIASAAAHGDTTYLAALGAIQNTLYGGIGQPTFDGTSPLTTDVLIKYTHYGDANLDGKIDGTDYSRIDNAYIAGGTGWFNGDFNYDSHVNGSDYTLIDNAFNMAS